MDTSPGYILMCKGAEEVQGAWIPMPGDWYSWYESVKIMAVKDLLYRETAAGTRYYDIRNNDAWCKGTDEKYLVFKISRTWGVYAFPPMEGDIGKAKKELHDTRRSFTHFPYCSWLPRQDQLQSILDSNVLELQGRIYRYVECTYPEGLWGELGFEPETMEQLWIAFVMYEKYGKTWNGKIWRKNKQPQSFIEQAQLIDKVLGEE